MCYHQMGAGGEKWSKSFFKVLERQNLRNQTMFELYADDNKSKYSSNPKEIFKSAKGIWKILHQWDNFQSCYKWIF